MLHYLDYKQFPPHSVKGKRIELDDQREDFPLLVIDKGSYIVDAVIESRIDLPFDEYSYNYQKGLYNVQIGKYVSIAREVLLMAGMNHNTNCIATGEVTAWQNIKGRSKNHRRISGNIIIGNDVWIGNRVTILDDVVIGDGAIIAAGAIVTKNVPPYAVVGGVPARVLKYRYSEDVIKKLLHIRWWDFSDQRLYEMYDIMHGDVNAFLDACADCQKEKEIIPIDTEKNNKTLCYRVDVDCNFSLLEHVLKEYCDFYQDKNSKLVLYTSNNIPIENLYDVLTRYSDRNVNVQIIDEDGSDIENVIRQSDVYIIGRSLATVGDLTLCSLYGIDVIAGSAYPVFVDDV